ncbi:MAG: hypothetical protein ACRAVC_18120 [Trichormus sp.]
MGIRDWAWEKNFYDFVLDAIATIKLKSSHYDTNQSPLVEISQLFP